MTAARNRHRPIQHSSPLAAAWNAALIFKRTYLHAQSMSMKALAGRPRYNAGNETSERECEGQHGVVRLTAVVWPHDQTRQPPGVRRPASAALRPDRCRMQHAIWDSGLSRRRWPMETCAAGDLSSLHGR